MFLFNNFIRQITISVENSIQKASNFALYFVDIFPISVRLFILGQNFPGNEIINIDSRRWIYSYELYFCKILRFNIEFLQHYLFSIL